MILQCSVPSAGALTGTGRGSMKVDLVKIQGNPVGIQVMAENDAERVLMAGLEGLVADGNRREEREAPSTLFLCLKMPVPLDRPTPLGVNV